MASSTSAVEALMSMMTGASIRIAKAKATPCAARLNLASARRAMTAARNGPSVAIMIQVAASGTQKRKMYRAVRLSPVVTQLPQSFEEVGFQLTTAVYGAEHAVERLASPQTLMPLR